VLSDKQNLDLIEFSVLSIISGLLSEWGLEKFKIFYFRGYVIRGFP